MTKTDWRSEGEPIWWKPYCKKYGVPMNGEIEICGFFDEILKQQIKAAQIEVLEQIYDHGLGVSPRNSRLMVDMEFKLKALKQK